MRSPGRHERHLLWAVMMYRQHAMAQREGLPMPLRRAFVVALLAAATVPACGGSTASGGPGGDGGGPLGDAAPVDSCTPKCDVNACDVSDGCGGGCQCATGVPCVGGTCGGCLGIANDGCLTSGPGDGSSPATCCGVSFSCKFYGDSSRCCGVTGQGGCVRDTDCCDFAVGARCAVVDAGNSDSGALPGMCE
jgi:hypothetical protein